MRKILALILVLCFCLPLLAFAEGVATTEVGTFPIVEEPYELTIWCVQPSEIEDYATNGQTVWYEEYSGIHVKWVTVPSQGRYTALQLSVMNGELPDMYFILLDDSDLDPMINYGAIICLEDLIDQYTVNMKSALASDPTLHDKVSFIDGKIYAAWEETMNTLSIPYRAYVYQPWLDAYENATGNGMPQTTDEFEQMLAYFRDNDMNGNGDASDEIPMLGMSGDDGFNFLMSAFEPMAWKDTAPGISLPGDGTAKFSGNTDAFRNGLRYMKRLYDEKLLVEESFIIDWTQRNAYVSVPKTDVRVGVLTADSIANAVVLSGDPDYVDYDDYVVIPPLEGPEGVRAAVSAADESITYRGVITSACERPDIAIRWLDYWYSDEGRQWILRGGQEGKQWWWDDGISINGEAKVVKQSTDYDLMHNAAWTTSVVPSIVKAEDFDTMDASQLSSNAYLRNELDRRLYLPYVVYHNWPTRWTTDKEIGTEFGEISANIRTYISQAYTSFVMGMTDIESDSAWEEYKQGLEAIGLSRYLEIANQVAAEQQ